ncbi:DUF2326 domain-containing protein [Bacillus sonorensis]|uniref:DUF2326 domain-containing protein n=1 Tax=Bacillus TaxID=1386 RepID=UPI0022807210|nr:MULTISPECIES: DUF2326 domain-containing protein [Bacillus]MCY8024724.1 DUF2326 domain-containing protein [Bacillus sonorensis]MCY8044610.1 DUF2326 domain-containing protein [Bacillus haynesii]MCY8078884.1 DUF2326 domain-containing protein [Bacillus haynesii]MCY8383562.1 DUF2326 domain-containing protein [Bacillus haynesii]MCY8590469.1 DUF2326 domain-containing protein [Bacillus haynesii]
MKILKLKIMNPKGDIVRDISFKEVGVSYIYGDIQDPKNLGATINSLGKTLLLKCIDYIFGANEDSNIIKESIHKYKLEAVILNSGKNYVIHRILGSSESIYINGKEYNLTEYKNYFGIKRSLYSKQFILKKKSSEISYRTNPSKEDVISCLELLNLSDILDEVNNIYESQDKIKNFKKNKKELVSFYGNFDIEQIDEEIYFIDKEVEKLTAELENISRKIKTIEISEIQKNIVEEYANKSKQLKKLKSKYEKNRLECERLIEFIDNSNKIDISSEHILAIFRKAQQEVPGMVQKTMQEAEEFHRKVYEERKEFLNEKKDVIEEEMNSLKVTINLLSAEINKIGAVISMNEVYQESIELYEKYNSDLQDLKYKQGKLSQVKDIDDAIETEDTNLINSFNESIQIRKRYEEQVQKYRDFMFKMTQNIYDNDVNSYFDIKVRQKHLTARPIIFEFTLKGDTGEGVSEVKKNLMDFLMCRYNVYMEMMIQDSACFNGIDPRQVAGMLTQLNKIAEKSNKQIIIAINKYQIGDHSGVISMVEKNSVITLSEKDNLLGIDF